MGYRLAGYVQFAFQLDVPVEQMQDGSFARFTSSMKDMPGMSWFELLPGSATAPTMEAMLPEQQTVSWFVKFAGPVASIALLMPAFQQLCEQHFPRAH